MVEIKNNEIKIAGIEFLAKSIWFICFFAYLLGDVWVGLLSAVISGLSAAILHELKISRTLYLVVFMTLVLVKGLM